ncbi:MAG: ABC transporter permease [Phycisphaeraceae bacterium]|nr:MAG: ABC transporter permease [Phycisphaeraceae bacterium]
MIRFLGILFTPIVWFGRIFFQTVMLALGQVWANKVRSILTALGIIIGTGSVIAVVGGLVGMKNFVLGEFETIGARKMWVWGEVPDSKETTISWDDVRMTPYEANLILENAPSVDTLSPICGTSEEISYGQETKRGVRVRGIWPAWHEIEDRGVIYGRPMSKIDVEERRQVCLINEAAIEELNLNRDPTGDFLLVGNRRFLIIGVLETKEASVMFGGGEARSELYIPFETSKMMNPYTFTYFVIQLDEPTDDRKMDDIAADARAEVRFILRTHRNLEGDDEDTFGIEVMANHIEQFMQVASVIGIIATAVVSISLLVGGIGIMNIMLVSVSERTREIGLRKAVGARPLVVLIQFLVEAVILCLVGGMIGLSVGFGLVMALKYVPNMQLDQATVPSWAVTLSLGFSAAVGVIFGMLPAIKAARLNPIDALRHE